MHYVHPDWFNKCAYVRLCKCSFEVNLNPCAAEFRRKLFTSEKILKNISVVGRWQVEEEKLYLTYAYPPWLKNVTFLLSSLKRRVMGHILGCLLKLACIKLHAFLDISHYYCQHRFVGAKMNTCYNCVDRHVEKGKGTQTALIYDSPLTGKVEMYSYQSLQDLVRMKLCNLQFLDYDIQSLFFL